MSSISAMAVCMLPFLTSVWLANALAGQTERKTCSGFEADFNNPENKRSFFSISSHFII